MYVCGVVPGLKISVMSFGSRACDDAWQVS